MSAPLAGNVDEPEGSLDALLQAMVCRQRVGWRTNSRKIILMATDRDFHFAMDGKLAGILERNDGLCHLNGTQDQSGYYTHSEILDYPSVSQISSVAQQNSFLLIFAVVSQYRSIWEAMSKLVPGMVDQQTKLNIVLISNRTSGSSVEILEEDSKNIVELITKRYEEITSSIKVKIDNVPEDVIVTIKSRCSGSAEIDTTSCNNVDFGSRVKFAADIRARSCLNESREHTFSISPLGLNQSLAVTVNTICECLCEQPGNLQFEADSPACSGGNGDNACGVCDCHDGFSGPACECDDRGQVGGGGKSPDDDPNGRSIQIIVLIAMYNFCS